jgi:hypothetical protein
MVPRLSLRRRPSRLPRFVAAGSGSLAFRIHILLFRANDGSLIEFSRLLAA